MSVKQKHDHHGRRILRILNRGEGNGKPPWLKFSLDVTWAKDLLHHKTAVVADYCCNGRLLWMNGSYHTSADKNKNVMHSKCNSIRIQNKHPMGCEAQLAWKWPVHAHFSRAILTHKVGQTGLVFYVRSGFISTYVHIRLKVSVHSDYDLFHPG